MAGTILNGRLSFSIEAASDAQVILFPKAKFNEVLIDSIELERMMFQVFQDEIDAARNWLLLISNPSVRARLSGFLLMLCPKYDNVTEVLDEGGLALHVYIPISRKDLSSLLGVRPESLSRAFRSLADEGIIEIITHDHVKVVSIDALHAEAGGDDFIPPKINFNSPLSRRLPR